MAPELHQRLQDGRGARPVPLFGAWYSCWRAYTCCGMTSSWPRPVEGSTVFMTPEALGYYQETFRQLALEYAVCWFPAAMPGTPARQGGGSGPAARRWSRTAAPPCPGRRSPPPPRGSLPGHDLPGSWEEGHRADGGLQGGPHRHCGDGAGAAPMKRARTSACVRREPHMEAEGDQGREEGREGPCDSPRRRRRPAWQRRQTGRFASSGRWRPS